MLDKQVDGAKCPNECKFDRKWKIDSQQKEIVLRTVLIEQQNNKIGNSLSSP